MHDNASHCLRLVPLLRRDVLELLSAVGLGYVFIFLQEWHRQSTCATSGAGLNEALPVTAAWASKFKYEKNYSIERKEFDVGEMSDKWTLGSQLTK